MKTSYIVPFTDLKGLWTTPHAWYW